MDIEGLFPKHAGCGEQPRLHEGGMMEPRLAAILVGRGGLEERRVGRARRVRRPEDPRPDERRLRSG